MTDLSPLQIPGMEGIWPGTLYAGGEMLDHLFEATDVGDVDDVGQGIRSAGRATAAPPL